MDWYSRYVLSWRLSTSLEADFCVEALNAALVKKQPEIFNSDQGSQFTSSDFLETLKGAGVKISLDGRGRAFDNMRLLDGKSCNSLPLGLKKRIEHSLKIPLFCLDNGYHFIHCYATPAINKKRDFHELLKLFNFKKSLNCGGPWLNLIENKILVIKTTIIYSINDLLYSK